MTNCGLKSLKSCSDSGNGKGTVKRLRKTIRKEPRPNQQSNPLKAGKGRKVIYQGKRRSSISMLGDDLKEVNLKCGAQRNCLKSSTSDVCFGQCRTLSKGFADDHQILEEDEEEDLVTFGDAGSPGPRYIPGDQILFNLPVDPLNEAKIFCAEEQDQLQDMIQNEELLGLHLSCSKPKNLLTKRELKMIPRHRVGKTNACCHICQDGFKKGQLMRKLFCGHKFHYNCVKPWFKKSSLCPVCKMDQKPEASIRLNQKINLKTNKNAPKQPLDKKSKDTPARNFKKKNTSLDTNCSSNVDNSRNQKSTQQAKNILDQVALDFDRVFENNKSMLQVDLELASRCSFATEMSLLNLLNDPVCSFPKKTPENQNLGFEMDLELRGDNQKTDSGFGASADQVCLGVEDAISVIQG